MNKIKKENIFNFVFMVFMPLLCGIMVSLVIGDNFKSIEHFKRTIVIPSIVFMIVWSLLYLLMGLWAYYYERDFIEDKLTISIYWMSIIVNLLFSPLLFLGNYLWLSFIDVVVLLAMIVYLFIKSLLQRKSYAYLLLPYVLWLIIANSLMIDLLLHN